MADSKPTDSAPAQDACPVDHKAREAWLAKSGPLAPHPPPAKPTVTGGGAPEEACPVDHKAREAWLAKSGPLAPHPTPPKPAVGGSGAPEEACPVDDKSREAWLAQARSVPVPETAPQQPPQAPAQQSWTRSLSSYLPFTSASLAGASTAVRAEHALGTHREVSSIPRTASDLDEEFSESVSRRPSNHEAETGRDASGRWVYPSEKMFFDAMRRKGMGAQADDMKTVVPIHNAVNERAWAEIVGWEKPYIGPSCDGPKLHSFAGDSTRMSPKARINTILGYTAPFDRHDWVVDRCGTRIEYIIDFYAGRAKGGGPGPSFYLDVRPKLNSLEGWKMRAMRGLGLA